MCEENEPTTRQIGLQMQQYIFFWISYCILLQWHFMVLGKNGTLLEFTQTFFKIWIFQFLDSASRDNIHTNLPILSSYLFFYSLIPYPCHRLRCYLCINNTFDYFQFVSIPAVCIQYVYVMFSDLPPALQLPNKNCNL